MFNRLIRAAASARALILTIVLLHVAGQVIAEEKPASGIEVKVFPVHKGDAVARVQTLQALFGQGTSATRPLRLAADRRTNTIIAVGRPSDLELIRGLLARLDQ
jgi:type II secretory pathway component GspD/PulD (secretin)